MRRRRANAGPRATLSEVLAALRLKAVLVRANGLTYRGILLGADEDEVYLKGELRYLALPMERITSIKSADARDHLDEHKSVAPEFYRDEDA